MKKHLSIITLFICIAFSSCTNWLTERQPGTTGLEEYYTSAAAAEFSVNACYTPLMWEYQNTYCAEWFIGDIVSDDALKGGQNTNDMADAYDMENWKTNTNNGLLLDFYRAQYQGISRCNLTISYVGEMEVTDEFSDKFKKRVLAEAHFLRAYYYFRLVRVFGGVPKVDFVIDSDSKWGIPRSSKEEIYAFILEDLAIAEEGLWLKSEYEAKDLGRATKGAAQAMLMKVNLYQHNYTEAKTWGEKVIASGEYALDPSFAHNFTLDGENNMESVFECQYVEDPTSDYGEGFGFTRGSFTQILTRSRSSQLGGGWGFNHPTQNLFDEYEEGDPRRDVTIFEQTPYMENITQEAYLGNPYINLKTTLYNGAVKTHARRSFELYNYATLDENKPTLVGYYFDESGEGEGEGQVPTLKDARKDTDKKGDIYKDVACTETLIEGIDSIVVDDNGTALLYKGDEVVGARKRGDNYYAEDNTDYRVDRGSYVLREEVRWYGLDHDARGPLNRKEIRYADVLLMYAEACEGAGDNGQAEWALEQVRVRSRAEAAEGALPAYPNYKIKINGVERTPSLRDAIRHERRVELAMEGHRWFDICRWGGFEGNGVKAHMDAYAATESDEAKNHMAAFVEGKHELFPIPSKEIELNPTTMTQNPGY